MWWFLNRTVTFCWQSFPVKHTQDGFLRSCNSTFISFSCTISTVSGGLTFRRKLELWSPSLDDLRPGTLITLMTNSVTRWAGSLWVFHYLSTKAKLRNWHGKSVYFGFILPVCKTRSGYSKHAACGSKTKKTFIQKPQTTEMRDASFLRGKSDLKRIKAMRWNISAFHIIPLFRRTETWKKLDRGKMLQCIHCADAEEMLQNIRRCVLRTLQCIAGNVLSSFPRTWQAATSNPLPLCASLFFPLAIFFLKSDLYVPSLLAQNRSGVVRRTVIGDGHRVFGKRLRSCRAGQNLRPPGSFSTSTPSEMRQTKKEGARRESSVDGGRGGAREIRVQWALAATGVREHNGRAPLSRLGENARPPLASTLTGNVRSRADSQWIVRFLNRRYFTIKTKVREEFLQCIRLTCVGCCAFVRQLWLCGPSHSLCDPSDRNYSKLNLQLAR